MGDLFAELDVAPSTVASPATDNDLAMISSHARMAGLLGLPRQEYADAEAESASLLAYAAGAQERAVSTQAP